MATKDRTSLKNEFKNGNLATGERFTDLIDSVKVVQLPVVDPQALGSTSSFIDSISQDADGKITATKKNVVLNYVNIQDKPQINGHTLSGDMSLKELGIINQIQLNDGTAIYPDQDGNVKLPVIPQTTNTITPGSAFVPTADAVDEALEDQNLLVPKANPYTATQKYNASANINDRSADVAPVTGEVKALGYKVLNPQQSFASQIANVENTIFEVTAAYDLGGQTVTLPSGCTLLFNGGCVYNGVISGSKMNTLEYGTPEMFGAGLTNDDTNAVQSALNVCKMVRMDGQYNVYANTNNTNNAALVIPSDTNVEINGAINYLTTTLGTYNILLIKNSTNVKIHGMGSLVGDKDIHTTTGGEWGHGIGIINSSSVEINGLDISKLWGDGVYIRYEGGICHDIIFDGLKIHDHRRQGISITGGHDITIRNCDIHDQDAESMGYVGSAVDIETHATNNPISNISVNGVKSKNSRLVVNPNSYQTSVSGITIDNCEFSSVSLYACDKSCWVRDSNLSYFSIKSQEGYKQGNTPTVSRCVFSYIDLAGACIFEGCELEGGVLTASADLQGDRIIFQKCNLVFPTNGLNTSYRNYGVLSIEFYDCLFKTLGVSSYQQLVNTTFTKCVVDFYNTAYGKYKAYNCEILCRLLQDSSETPFLFYNDDLQIYGGTVRILSTRDAYLYRLNRSTNPLVMEGVLILDEQSTRRLTYGSTGPLYDNGTIYINDNKDYKSGESSNRPTLRTTDTGFPYFDVTLNKLINWNGSSWVEEDGEAAGIKRTGTSAQRPTSTNIGFKYFDITIGKPIFWNGVSWIDANGDYIFDNSGTLQNRLAITSPVKGQQFKLTREGETDVYLIYGDYGWLNATDRSPWFDDSGTLNAMYDKYNYTLLTEEPSNWPTAYNTYYKIVDGVYTKLTASETWALDTYYKKDENVYTGIQVNLTDDDTELYNKVVKWNGTKYINIVDNVALKAGTPTLAFGEVEEEIDGEQVTVTQATITSTSSGKLYYTKDGNNPKSSSTEYRSAITLVDGDQVKAICIRDHMDNSAVGFVKVAKPVITFNDGILHIECDTPDAKIYYTTDGNPPSTSSTVYDSSASVTIATGITVKAFAVLIGRVNSEIASKKRS